MLIVLRLSEKLSKWSLECYCDVLCKIKLKSVMVLHKEKSMINILIA